VLHCGDGVLYASRVWGVSKMSFNEPPASVLAPLFFKQWLSSGYSSTKPSVVESTAQIDLRHRTLQSVLQSFAAPSWLHLASLLDLRLLPFWPGL